MSLDVRTIMVVFSVVMLLFSGLLALVRKYSDGIDGIDGVGHWALANVLISVGFGFSYWLSSFVSGQTWPIVFASVLIVSGLCLQLSGIQRFKGKPTNWRFAFIAVSVVLLNGVWFSRSGRANLNNFLSGNSGHKVWPRMAGQTGVFYGQEISTTHPAHAHARVQGAGGPCRFA